MVRDLTEMTGYRSGAMTLQSSVLIARMQTELNACEKLKKRPLEFAGMS